MCTLYNMWACVLKHRSIGLRPLGVAAMYAHNTRELPNPGGKFLPVFSRNYPQNDTDCAGPLSPSFPLLLEGMCWN